MTTQPPWNDVQIFLAVVQAGSASRAAVSMGVDHTTIGRRVKALEAMLGVALFERLAGTRLTLTEAGRIVLVEAERMSANCDALLRRVAAEGKGLKGEVRIGSSDGVVNYWLMAAIAGFQQQHPGLTMSWTNTFSVVDIGRQVDIGLRWEKPDAPSLIARRLGTVRALLYAMPSYVERYGLPTTADELGDHHVLHFLAYENQAAFEPWNLLMARYPPAMRLATSFSSERALREGRYVALLPSYTPQIEPTIAVAPLDLGITVDLWLAYHEDHRSHVRVKLVAAEIFRLARQARGSWFLD